MTEPLAYPPKDVSAVTGIAYTRVRAAIDSGELEVVWHSPKRCVVPRASVEKWLASLPTERPGAA